jgi:hypothetical protein
LPAGRDQLVPGQAAGGALVAILPLLVLLVPEVRHMQRK